MNTHTNNDGLANAIAKIGAMQDAATAIQEIHGTTHLVVPEG